jgi:hypothetical protein
MRAIYVGLEQHEMFSIIKIFSFKVLKHWDEVEEVEYSTAHCYFLIVEANMGIIC